ncbi:MAG: hypothetical protein ACK523_08025, partial [Pirellulaceae bacterium]
ATDASLLDQPGMDSSHFLWDGDKVNCTTDQWTKLARQHWSTCGDAVSFCSDRRAGSYQRKC